MDLSGASGKKLDLFNEYVRENCDVRYVFDRNSWAQTPAFRRGEEVKIGNRSSICDGLWG